MTQDWKDGTRAVIEANLWKFDDGTYFLGQTATRIIDHVEALLKEERLAVLEEVERGLPQEFKRQDLGNRWNLETGEMQPYWCQSQESVDYYNDCRQEVITIINTLRVK